MKIEIDAVPVSTLDDIQNTLRVLSNPCKSALARKGAFGIRKEFIKGIQVAIDVIEVYKKGNELTWTDFSKWLAS